MKFLKIVLLLLSITQCCSAQNNNFSFRGYSGGMMFHSGYVKGKELLFMNADGTFAQPLLMQGAPRGIGGAIKLWFGKHLRVGCEGYVSTLRYGNYNSYSTTGWRGFLVDYALVKQRWTFFAGGTLGGGNVKNITFLNDIPLDYQLENQNTSYRRYSFMALAPFAGFEYAWLERIHLVFKVDYLLNVSNPQPDFVIGPRIYLGIMFSHFSDK